MPGPAARTALRIAPHSPPVTMEPEPVGEPVGEPPWQGGSWWLGWPCLCGKRWSCLWGSLLAHALAAFFLLALPMGGGGGGGQGGMAYLEVSLAGLPGGAPGGAGGGPATGETATASGPAGGTMQRLAPDTPDAPPVRTGIARVAPGRTKPENGDAARHNAEEPPALPGARGARAPEAEPARPAAQRPAPVPSAIPAADTEARTDAPPDTAGADGLSDLSGQSGLHGLDGASTGTLAGAPAGTGPGAGGPAGEPGGGQPGARGGGPAGSGTPGATGAYGGPGPFGYAAHDVDVRPAVRHRVPPEYPDPARRTGTQGRVVLRLLVDEQGRARHVSVLEATPGGIFEQCAMDAVARWTFTPGTRGGRAVPTWVHLPLRFDLTPR